MVAVMPSWDHEGIVELFRSDPQLVPELLSGPLGIALPPFSATRVESGEFTQLNPAELRSDLVVSLSNGEQLVLAVIVEVQRDIDDDKSFSWPSYVASLRHRLRCNCCVLVVTQSERVANWASRQIHLGPGGSLQPLVLRPSSVPVVDDPDQARQAPELAVLSAVVHGGGNVETAVKIALAAASAAHDLDRNQFLLYFGLIISALSDAGRKAFKMQPQGMQFFDESQRQSFNRGRAEYATNAVVAVLESRELPISNSQRDRIESCSDLTTLDRWIRRAAVVSSVEELFE